MAQRALRLLPIRRWQCWPRAVAVAAAALGLASAPSAAHAAPSRAAAGAKAKPTAKAQPSSATGALLVAIRAELVEASRDKRDSDLGNLLLSGTIEGAFTTLLQSAHALSSLGQALRCGAAPPEDAVVVARETSRNLENLGKTWVALARLPVFAGQGAVVFRELDACARRGAAAADALRAWAEQPQAATRTGAFEERLTAFRGSVIEIAHVLRGPEADRTPPATAPEPAPPAP